MRDLVLADTAGVIDLHDTLKDSETGVSLLLSRYMSEGEVTAGDDDREELFYQLLGRPPEEVDV